MQAQAVVDPRPGGHGDRPRIDDREAQPGRRDALEVPRLGEEREGFVDRLARNLERITPPWLSFAIVDPGPVAMATGTRIDYRLRLHGVPIRWTAVIEDWRPGHEFVDRQIRGPYRLWHHRHEFIPHPDGTIVVDHVPLRAAGGAAGRRGARAGRAPRP